MKINWKQQNKEKILFRDVPLNGHFKIATSASHGAVYRKVYNDTDGTYMAMEEFSGKIFRPTNSAVLLVDATLTIDEEKPTIYN